MSAIFPRIFSFFAVLVAIAALAACGAEKKVSQAPIPDFKPPQELPAVEQKAPEPPAPEEADEAKAGKSRSKKEKRTPVEEEYDEEEEEEEEEDVLDNSNIFFQYASAELSPAAKRELARVAAIMKRNKSARVTLTGHTCDKSSASVNIRLSQKRANAASGYLQQLGVSARRISVDGHGYSQPLAPNTSEKNRAKNRRVEITVEE